MKLNPNARAIPALAILAATFCCGTARADLGTETSTTTVLTSWNTDPNGHSPFYEAQNLSEGESGDSQPGAAASAAYTVLSETFSITNGAGNVLPNGNTNYVLTGIGLLCSGSGATPLSIHLFDITSNLTGAVTASSASYNFTANGDLLGGGNGLNWVNNTNSGAEQQVYLPLTQGPNSYDQVVLGAGHIYALEVWTPASAAGEFYWLKESATADTGGLAMGSVNASFSVTRDTISALGQVGSAPHDFGLALYGSITNQAPSANTSTNTAVVTNYLIDAFNATGYGPANPYVGTTNYSAGQLDLLWTNWYGGAWVTNLWDPTHDAGGNSPNSGSLQIVANFAAGTQYLVSDYPQGINPPLNALTTGINSFQCDVLFSNGSATTVNGSVTNYGHLQFGISPSPAFSAADMFGTAVEVPVGTTSWTHVNIPISVASDANLESINNVVIKIDGNWYSSSPLAGPSVLWVDNIKFVGPASPPAVPTAPTLNAQKAMPGLRIFAASTVNTYDREELDTVDQNQSWIGVKYPVTYSFTLQDFPIAPGMQCHLFLVPVNSLPSGNAPTANEYVDYQAGNNVWLDIVGGAANPSGTAGYSVGLFWKTNTPNANAATEALNTGTTYSSTGSQSPVGAWSLTFNAANAGTLTPPGVAPQPFTIQDPNIAADFANPVIALIGLQPNSTAGEGTYIDYAAISITGVQDGNEVENFVTDEAAGITAISGGGSSGFWDTSDSVNSGAVDLVNSTTPLWVYWSLPDVGFGLGVSPLLPTQPANYGNTSGNIGGYVLPQQYSGYYDDPIVASRAGGTNWTLIPSACLPSAEYPTLTNAYFILGNPPPAN